MSSTALKVPGWYIEFQSALLRQAPRPGEIDQVTAERWTNNQKGLKKNLASCLLPYCWWEQDGVIYFSVTSDGTTGEYWITRLESKGFRMGDYAKQVLRSPGFKPTSGVTTEVAVLKGMVFEDQSRVTSKIRAFATEHKFESPNAEVACLIREKFTDKKIEAAGLIWITVMHKPINDRNGNPSLLGVGRGDGGCWINTSSGRPSDRWLRVRGFAFALSKNNS